MKIRNAVRRPTGSTSIPADVYQDLQLWAIVTLEELDSKFSANQPVVGIRHSGEFTSAYIEFEVEDAD